MVIADTGFWLALANRRDRHHEQARAALGRLEEPLVTTWPVLTETCHLLVNRLGPEALFKFIESATRGAFELFELTPRHFPTLLVLMQKYRDLPMDLADASLVVVAEELGSGRILSTDRRDFGAYRWKNRRPFKNLMAID
ncbi:MAG TPA: PIN domain-containing protein [Polyangiaceae bacterium]